MHSAPHDGPSLTKSDVRRRFAKARWGCLRGADLIINLQSVKYLQCPRAIMMMLGCVLEETGAVDGQRWRVKASSSAGPGAAFSFVLRPLLNGDRLRLRVRSSRPVFDVARCLHCLSWPARAAERAPPFGLVQAPTRPPPPTAHPTVHLLAERGGAASVAGPVPSRVV